MSIFPQFRQKYGVGDQCTPHPAGGPSALLPEQLTELWRTDGFCSYGGGLFWTIPPSYMSDVVEQWLGNEGDLPQAIARTAFGDLFLWGQGGVHFLNVHTGNITRVTNGIEPLFDAFLCAEKNIDGVLRKGLFDDAVSRLGPLSPDECYAFVPALALGGSGSIETVQRVRMVEHLNLLAQLQE